MKILCECGLVEARKEGKWQHYSLNLETFLAFKQYIVAIIRDGAEGSVSR